MLLSDQAMFDKVVGHLRQQGRPGGNYLQRGWGYINPENPCQRCAQGVLMDSNWKENIKKVGEMSYSDSLNTAGRLKSADLLLALQATYEMSELQNWEKDFQRLAKKYNLVYKLPTKQIVKEVVNG